MTFLLEQWKKKRTVTFRFQKFAKTISLLVGVQWKWISYETEYCVEKDHS